MSDAALKNLMARVALEELDTSGDYMTAIARGRAGERLGDNGQKIMFLGQHGYGSAPMPGSTGMALFQNGNPDQAFLIGLEHPQYRIKGLQPGEAVLYDHMGNVVKMTGAGGIQLNANGNPINMTGGALSMGAGSGPATLTCASMTITTTGPVTINSPQVNLGGEGGSPVRTVAGVAAKVLAV